MLGSASLILILLAWRKKKQKEESEKEKTTIVVPKKQEFSITQDQCDSIRLSKEPITVLSFMKNINSVIDSNSMEKLTSTRINKWLSKRGLVTTEKVQTNVINFLGFSFDGKNVRIRSKTNSKYYYRMYRKARFISKCDGYASKGTHISERNLYEKYSERGMNKGNYLSYVRRAQKEFGSEQYESISRDTKNHMRKIAKAKKAQK